MTLAAVVRSRRADILRRFEEISRASNLALESMPEPALLDSLPLFLDELVEVLGATSETGPASFRTPVSWRVAREHGEQRLGLGLDVAALVREYQIVRECILEAAEEAGATPTLAEFRALSGAMSDATAESVRRYSEQRDAQLRRQASEHFAFIAHELRNPLSSSVLALTVLKRRGLVQEAKPLAALERGLERMSALVDQTLVDLRLRAGSVARFEAVALLPLLARVVEDAATDSDDRGQRVEIVAAESLALHGDPRMIFSAISNLVRNAIKFTDPGGAITLSARVADRRLLIEVEDQCGGLPPDKVESIFDPYVQIGIDRSGFGLGLAITRQAAEAHRGTVQVRNLPGKGCVFVLDLPVTTPPAPTR